MIPSWLGSAQSDSYISDVLSMLSQRERQRVVAREGSRPMIQPDAPPVELEESSLSYYYSISVGADPTLQAENRYQDIIPYNRTKFLFAPGAIVDNSGYLNANWVREAAGGKWWIATQAPLPNTAHTFLSVLLQPRPLTNLSGEAVLKPSRVRTIVQLTRDLEGGVRKAHPYFPPKVGQHYVIPGATESIPPIRVTLEATRAFPKANCIISTVSIVGVDDMPITFNHLLYTAWPDHGVPVKEDQESLMNFVRLVDKVNRQPLNNSNDPDPPAMVNCSAGIGRTGAFIVLSSLLRAHGLLPPATNPSGPQPPQSPLGPIPSKFASDLIAQEIDSCREQRVGMVQRDEQIRFVYNCMRKELSRRN